ncbi:MAG: tetraacyldisaccharide 4'-kinase [Phycisphaerales bacterium]|nr:tetraacyldisaccharide 4'-kinase [Phycisphaerales bacterium]
MSNHAPSQSATRPATSAAPPPGAVDRPIVPGLPGRLAAMVYGAAIARRNRAFDAGRGVVTLDRPVISVGNLSTGGTGKSPMVAWIVRALRDAGHDPCIAMRGYRSRDGLSDEAEEYRAAFDDLPVVARPHRLHGLIELFASERGERVDSVVLDDGFQHRRIARGLDLALIDATRDPFADALIPAGRLREPVGSLRRATHVVITHAERVEPDVLARLAQGISRVHGRPPIAVTEHAWSELRITDSSGVRAEPVSWLRGRHVLAVCAIGNPAPFLGGVQERGAHVVDAIVLRDHDRYAPRTISRIVRRIAASCAEAVVTTAKDWTKLARRDLSALGVPVVRPTLELRFREGESALRAIVSEPPV